MTMTATEKEFVFEDWVSEGMKGIHSHLRRRRGLLPEEFHNHMRAARKETLLAVRSLLDTIIESEEKPRPKKATKIKVE
jgi:hypothetical protein